MESLIKERSCLVGVMNTKEERSLIMGRVSTFNGFSIKSEHKTELGEFFFLFVILTFYRGGEY